MFNRALCMQLYVFIGVDVFNFKCLVGVTKFYSVVMGCRPWVKIWVLLLNRDISRVYSNFHTNILQLTGRGLGTLVYTYFVNVAWRTPSFWWVDNEFIKFITTTSGPPVTNNCHCENLGFSLERCGFKVFDMDVGNNVLWAYGLFSVSHIACYHKIPTILEIWF